jgi:hypothetical protein
MTVAETTIEFGIGVALFVTAYRGITGKWPWDRKP